MYRVGEEKRVTDSRLAVVILAAGQGTRMKSATPKLLHELAGLPIIAHVLAAIGGLDAIHVAAVVRHERDLLAAAIHDYLPAAIIVDQDDVPGTGRAVEQAFAAARQHAGVDVGQRDPALVTDPARETGGQIAGAAGQIQHPVTRAHGGQLQRKMLPGAVDAERHQVVHQIIAIRHRVEYGTHAALFIRPRDAFIAKIDSILAHRLVIVVLRIHSVRAVTHTLYNRESAVKLTVSKRPRPAIAVAAAPDQNRLR